MMPKCAGCALPWTECECGKPFRGDPTVVSTVIQRDPIPAQTQADGFQALVDKVIQQQIKRESQDVFRGLICPPNEIRVTDPNTGGQKGSKPERMDLLPWDTLMEVSKHYAKGAEKYDDRNWERGYDYHLSFAALQRHLAAWWQGEDIDAETGSNHLDAVIFHALLLRTYQLRGIGNDDRP